MQVLYKDEAVKNLKKVNPSDLKKVYRKIQTLTRNPLLGKQLQGNHEGQYSLRAWPLRIIYTFDADTQVITIITVDYRGAVYKN